MKFEIYSRRGIRGKRWYWRLKARNGEIIAQGEGYKNKKDCLHCVGLIQASSGAVVNIKE